MIQWKLLINFKHNKAQKFKFHKNKIFNFRNNNKIFKIYRRKKNAKNYNNKYLKNLKLNN